MLVRKSKFWRWASTVLLLLAAASFVGVTYWWSSPAVSPAECEKLASQFLTAIRNGDVAAADRLVDRDEMLRRAARGVNLTNTVREAFVQSYQQAGPDASIQTIVQLVAQGGRYEFLRVHVAHSERRILFRLIVADGALTYHDFVIHRHKSGEPKIADSFFFATGELSSESTRRFMSQAAFCLHFLKKSALQ